MEKDTDAPKNVTCSFCGKSQDQVEKVVAGPGVYICDECVDLCNDIMEDIDVDTAQTIEDLPKPAEIRDILDDYVIGQNAAKRAKEMSCAVFNHLVVSDSL